MTSALEAVTEHYARQAAAHRRARAEIRERVRRAGALTDLERWHLLAAELLERADRSERREFAADRRTRDA